MRMTWQILFSLASTETRFFVKGWISCINWPHWKLIEIRIELSFLMIWVPHTLVLFKPKLHRGGKLRLSIEVIPALPCKLIFMGIWKKMLMFSWAVFNKALKQYIKRWKDPSASLFLLSVKLFWLHQQHK